MKLSRIKRKNVTHYYITESFRDGNKVSSRTIKKLGTDKEICKKYKVKDAEKWAKQQVENANALNKKSKAQSSSKFKGVEYIKNLYENFGVSYFVNSISCKSKQQKADLYNLMLFLILDCMYFPESAFTNMPYFQEGYFKDKKLNLTLLNKLYDAVANNYHALLGVISQNIDSTYVEGPVLLYNTKLDKSLILPKNTNGNSKTPENMSILINADGIPITMLHDSFTNETNEKNIENALVNFGFVDIYSNGDSMNVGKMLPKKGSLKKFKRLSIKEVKAMVQHNLFYNNTWTKIAFEQKSFMKGYSDIYYKEFSIKENNNFKVVALYGSAFEIVDAENKINTTYAMLDNPQCTNQIKDNVNRFVSQSVYNHTYSGYRYYLLPKKMPASLAASFDYNHSVIIKMMNNIPYSNSKYVRNTSLENYTISAQVIYYIVMLFACCTIRNSKYYISSMKELAFFLQSIDSSAFTKQFSSYIDNWYYRLGADSN